MHEGSRELQIPQTTVWPVLKKRPQMKLFVIQLMQQMKQKDYGKCMNYVTFKLERMKDETMVGSLIFNDEATFHIKGEG